MLDISICIVHSARSLVTHKKSVIELFPRCVKSMNAAVIAAALTAELVVVDWPQNRCGAPLETWFAQTCQISARVIDADGDFNKGRACNMAARAATAPVLFFCDCDMLVTPGVLLRGVAEVRAGKAWFPLCLSQQGLGSDVFKVPSSAACCTGNAFMSREDFAASGGWPETTVWKLSDLPMAKFFERRKMLAEPLSDRKPNDGFVHLWHPKHRGWGSIE